jgi:large subunit ribosomal protein L20
LLSCAFEGSISQSPNSTISKFSLCLVQFLQEAKGFYGKRKNVYTVAKNVLEKGLQYRYVGRKLKKREYRTLWIARINAAVREEGLTYSEFIHLLANKGISVDRKILADLAMNEPASFKSLVASVK